MFYKSMIWKIVKNRGKRDKLPLWSCLAAKWSFAGDGGAGADLTHFAAIQLTFSPFWFFFLFLKNKRCQIEKKGNNDNKCRKAAHLMNTMQQWNNELLKAAQMALSRHPRPRWRHPARQPNPWHNNAPKHPPRNPPEHPGKNPALRLSTLKPRSTARFDGRQAARTAAGSDGLRRAPTTPIDQWN